MRAGIVTFHYSYNYGAVLQAWALRQALRDLGVDAEVLDFRPREGNAWYRGYARPLRLHHPRLNRWHRSFRRKAERIDAFLARELGVTSGGAHDLATAAADRDVLVAGSDQVWSTDPHLEPAFFLDFARPHQRRVSYAASFGNTESLGQDHARIARWLSAFDTILVRDTNSRDQVVSCGLPAPAITVDPVLIADLAPITTPWDGARPVVVYSERALTRDEEREARRIADDLGAPIVAAGIPHPVADHNLVELGVEEWLGLMAAAAHVVTGMFHGVMFAIKGGIPFTPISLGTRVKVLQAIDAFDCRPGEHPGLAADPVTVQRSIERSRDLLRAAVLDGPVPGMTQP